MSDDKDCPVCQHAMRRKISHTKKTNPPTNVLIWYCDSCGYFESAGEELEQAESFRFIERG